MTEKAKEKSAAVYAYERILREVSEQQAVDHAEETLAQAWVVELELQRRAALLLAETTRLAVADAYFDLRQARQGGLSADVARALSVLAQRETERKSDLRRADGMLDSVDRQLEDVCRAGLARSLRGRDDVARLRTAWVSAYGC